MHSTKRKPYKYSHFKRLGVGTTEEPNNSLNFRMERWRHGKISKNEIKCMEKNSKETETSIEVCDTENNKPSCLCQPGRKLLKCNSCQYKFYARKSVTCSLHPDIVYLMDARFCVRCAAPIDQCSILNSEHETQV